MFVTAIALSVPFGLSFPGLIAQVFKTAAGYPYLSVNAFNPWALVIQATEGGGQRSIVGIVHDNQVGGAQKGR